MPRPYRLGARATLIAATRERILDAAIDLYQEGGASATTLIEIGRRADVAPGTLRNHFPNRESLDRAMIDRLQAEAPLPELSLYDGAGSLAERLARLVRAAGTFFDGSTRLLRMWRREPMLTEPWVEAGSAYGARWNALMRAALEPRGDDDVALSMLRAILDPAVFERAGDGTRSTAEVCELVTALITPWFVVRAAATGSSEGPAA